MPSANSSAKPSPPRPVHRQRLAQDTDRSHPYHYDLSAISTSSGFDAIEMVYSCAYSGPAPGRRPGQQQQGDQLAPSPVQAAFAAGGHADVGCGALAAHLPGSGRDLASEQDSAGARAEAGQRCRSPKAWAGRLSSWRVAQGSQGVGAMVASDWEMVSVGVFRHANLAAPRPCSGNCWRPPLLAGTTIPVRLKVKLSNGRPHAGVVAGWLHQQATASHATAMRRLGDRWPAARGPKLHHYLVAQIVVGRGGFSRR